MYRYDDFDAAFVAARVEQFRDQVARRLSGELTEEQFRPHRLMNGLYLQLHSYMLRDRRALRHAEVAPDAQARRDRPQIRPRLRPFHHPAEHPVQLAGAEGHARHSRRALERRNARDPDLGQLHPQRHRRSFRRRRRTTRSPIRGPTPRSSGNGRRSIPNSRSCRASSRSRSTARRHDRAVIQAHDIGLQVVRNDAGRDRLYRLCRRRPRPHAVDRPQGPRVPARARPPRLCRGDPARLQSRRPARQQVQGAHQDPRAREERSRRCAQRDRGGIRRARPEGARLCRRRKSPASPPISPRPSSSRRSRSATASSAARARTTRFASFLALQRRRPTRRRATSSSPSR